MRKKRVENSNVVNVWVSVLCVCVVKRLRCFFPFRSFYCIYMYVSNLCHIQFFAFMSSSPSLPSLYNKIRSSLPLCQLKFEFPLGLLAFMFRRTHKTNAHFSFQMDRDREKFFFSFQSWIVGFILCMHSKKDLRYYFFSA